jgi:nucleoside-diphosphate-sugar epimerase
MSGVKNYYGLCFGTVNGWSWNPRLELMLNSMYVAATTKGKINLSNPKKFRAILGIQDLCRGIEAILTTQAPAGIYNMASFNSTIDELAKEVSDFTGAKINLLPDSPTYSFQINSQKFESAFGFKFQDEAGDILQDLRKLDLCDILGKEDSFKRIPWPNALHI